VQDNIKILVCTHKKSDFPKDDIYLPIQVGKSISDIDLDIQGDNTGDNISEKNPYYAELTGQYWGWKNLKDVKYVGLCHYRRYFDLSSIKRKNGQMDFDRIFKKYDIVLVKPFLKPCYNAYSFSEITTREDLADRGSNIASGHE
jgi:hypothetical protein